MSCIKTILPKKTTIKNQNQSKKKYKYFRNNKKTKKSVKSNQNS